MSLDLKTLRHVAKLANLEILPGDFSIIPQLSEAALYIGILNELDTKKTDETSQVTGEKNVLRSDNSSSSLSQSEALSQARFVQGGYFKTGLVIKKK